MWQIFLISRIIRVNDNEIIGEKSMRICCVKPPLVIRKLLKAFFYRKSEE